MMILELMIYSKLRGYKIDTLNIYKSKYLYLTYYITIRHSNKRLKDFKDFRTL